MAIDTTIIPTNIDLSKEVDDFTIKYDTTNKLHSALLGEIKEISNLSGAVTDTDLKANGFAKYNGSTPTSQEIISPTITTTIYTESNILEKDDTTYTGNNANNVTTILQYFTANNDIHMEIVTILNGSYSTISNNLYLMDSTNTTILATGVYIYDKDNNIQGWYIPYDLVSGTDYIFKFDGGMCSQTGISYPINTTNFSFTNASQDGTSVNTLFVKTIITKYKNLYIKVK